MAKRLQHMPQSAHKYRHGFRPTFHADEIRKFRERAAGWRKPRRVFVGSMGDIMDPGFSVGEIAQVIQVARDLPWHKFLFLTKRPKRYRRFNWPTNAWLGATANDAATLKRAAFMGHADYFNHADVSVRFLSIEPLTEQIHLPLGACWNWIIIGAMTGPGAKPPERKWIADLTQQADRRGTPVFHKPNLERYFGTEFVRREFPCG